MAVTARALEPAFLRLDRLGLVPLLEAPRRFATLFVHRAAAGVNTLGRGHLHRPSVGQLGVELILLLQRVHRGHQALVLHRLGVVRVPRPLRIVLTVQNGAEDVAERTGNRRFSRRLTVAPSLRPRGSISGGPVFSNPRLHFETRSPLGSRRRPRRAGCEALGTRLGAGRRRGHVVTPTHTRTSPKGLRRQSLGSGGFSALATALALSADAMSLIIARNASPSQSKPSSTSTMFSGSFPGSFPSSSLAKAAAKRAAAPAVFPRGAKPPSIAAPRDPEDRPCLAAIARRSSSPYVLAGCCCCCCR